MKARRSLFALFALLPLAMVLKLVCFGETAEAARMVNGGWATSGVVDAGSACLGICCVPPANGSGSYYWCEPWMTEYEAGLGWPDAGWAVTNDVIANSLPQTLGCMTSRNVAMAGDGLHLTGTPYDGGACTQRWDAGAAVTISGYGAEIFRRTADPLPAMFTVVVSIPSGSNSCSSGGNCSDPTIWQWMMTTDAAAGAPYQSISPNVPDIWVLGMPGSPDYPWPYPCPGNCAPEIDHFEDYTGEMNHSAFFGSLAAEHSLSGSFSAYGTPVKFWEATVAGSTRISGGVSDAIDAGNITTATPMFTLNESRMTNGFVGTYTMVVQIEAKCGIGDGGPCF